MRAHRLAVGDVPLGERHGEVRGREVLGVGQSRVRGPALPLDDGLDLAADGVDAIDRIGLRIFSLLFVMVSLGVLAGIWSSVRARRDFAEECRKIQSVHDRAPGEPTDTKGMAGRRKSAVETLLAVQRQQSTHLQDIYREPSGGETDGVSTGGAILYSRLESPKREMRDDLFGA